MPSTATAPTLGPRRERGIRKKKKQKRSPLAWWPVLLGIAVTPFTVRAASVLALSGPQSLDLLYPYVMLLKNPAFGLPAELASNLSQLMMYVQFPLHGLLLMLNLRNKRLLPSLLIVAAVHFVCFAVLFALPYMH